MAVQDTAGRARASLQDEPSRLARSRFGYSRGSLRPRSERPTRRARATTATATIRPGCLRWRSDSQITRAQSTTTAAPAPTAATITGARNAAFSNDHSNSQAASAVKPTEAAAAATSLRTRTARSVIRVYPSNVGDASYTSGDDYVV